MKRLLPAMLALAAPAALAWPSCDQAGLSPPVALAREAPAYPAAVRDIGIEGSVEVALTILRDGRVGWVRVLHADPPGYFEQAAVAGVRGWRFEPARQNGTAVECRQVTRVRFTLVDTVDATGQPLASNDRPDPVYPARLTGQVAFEVATNADGTIQQARILSSEPKGLFDRSALAIAKASRMTPAYRDSQPFAALALLTIFFDSNQASCPGSLAPDPQRPTKARPPPAVSGHDELPAGRADRLAALFRIAGQQVPLTNRRQPAAVQLHGSPR